MLTFLQEESRPGGLVEKAMQCTQYPGDILLVPALWGHATLNLTQCIGVAYEFAIDGFPL